MAKRKRLSPAEAPEASLNQPAAAPETKYGMAVPPNGWVGVRRRAPIADVAGDAAARAALDEVSAELHSARREGRLVLALPLASVEAGHLERDRVVLDAEEMAVLRDSLRDRGQQTPVEVVDLGAGRYGLISGWRRLTALRALYEETGAARFAEIKALVRAPDSAADAYRAMVEENEIRADLSFYERAHIACKAVEQGIYPDVHAAVQGLFAAARAPKRSKIVAFTALIDGLGEALHFPAAISEKVGLALVAALRADSGFADRLRAALKAAPPVSAAEERKVIEAALQSARPAAQAPASKQMPQAIPVTPGIALTQHRGRLVLSGSDVDDDLARDLRAWLKGR